MQGHLDSLINKRQVLYRCGKTRPKDRLEAWIRHLIGCADGRLDLLETAFYGLDKANKFLLFEPLPVEEAMGYLKNMLSIFHAGQARPLPFFPATSLAYQTEIEKASDPANDVWIERAFSKARIEWLPTDFSHGGRTESELAENRVCFPMSPLDHLNLKVWQSQFLGQFFIIKRRVSPDEYSFF